jgi:DNA-directed RNA polymerase specialized sigma24 family protein
MDPTWTLTREAFDHLLTWLDPNPEGAAAKYEQIRSRLITIFASRGCVDAEDLADETINRTTKAIQKDGFVYEGNPALFFYGTAKLVFLETFRRRPVPLSAQLASVPQEEDSTRIECLEECLGQLPPRVKQVLSGYYEHQRQAKIDYHRVLAEQLGVTVNALRIQVYRMRRTLRECVLQCTEAIAQKDRACQRATE